jgi:uncharacterized 2Fe-2S/4Fe-4S cluster protein (DUF4445 family)
VARALDRWAQEGTAPGHADDATEYVAKLGINSTGSVIVMSRAHDQVLVPPPARAALAALALAEQPFGFTHADVAALRRAAEQIQAQELATSLGDLGDRLAALLPPAAT